MGKKLIRLKPLTPFFFGTNKTFSDDTLHDVTSSYFPQQTHLLGMLRFFLLQSNGYTKLRKRGRWVSTNNFKKAFDLVGGYDKKNSTQQRESLGIIKSLSPVFIVSRIGNKIEDFHFIAPKDTGLDIEVLDTGDLIYTANSKREKLYSIENYNPKMGYVNALTTSLFWKKYNDGTLPKRSDAQKIDESYLKSLHLLDYSSVFENIWQVGIKRDAATKTVQSDDEGSFYTKTSYSFKKESYEFACIVDFEEEIKVNEAFVYLGAERSAFKLEIEEYTSELDALFPSGDNESKHIALSDIQVNNFDNIEYMLNDGYIAHAHMDREKKKDGKASSKYSKSEQQHFIPKGSVIYFKDGFNVQTLDSTIGYNTFITKEEK